MIADNITGFSLSDSWDRPTQYLFAMEPRHPAAYYTMLHIQSKLVHELMDVVAPRVVFTTGPDALLRGFNEFLYGTDIRKNYPPAPEPPIAGDPLWVDLAGMYGKIWRKYKYTATHRISKWITPFFEEIVPYNGANMTRKSRANAQMGSVHWQANVLKTRKGVSRAEHRSCVAQLKLVDADPNFEIKAYG